jgi:para-aminobenzoate synthetase component 1
LIQAIEIADPLAAARALGHLPYPFVLHSAMRDVRARWSFFGADPFAVVAGDDDGDAALMWRRFAREVEAADEGPPFMGGIVGYWAYDFGRRLERLPSLAEDDLGLPAVRLGFYDVIGAYDHQTRRAWLVSTGLPLEGAMRRDRARRRLEAFTRLTTFGRRAGMGRRYAGGAVVPAISTFGPEDYRAAVERVKEFIRAGDIFQANLSQRWTVEVAAAAPSALALALVESLAAASPAPFAAWLGGPDHAIASASPERFLQLRRRQVETRPIKGTRPRGADPLEDRRLRVELLESAKDRAENVMIVDVLRNDLGRVCETGSVQVSGLCELETFAQVHHLTSTVGGVLRPDLDAFDLLHACFPGGSITGAPKIRAMEILESLEPVRRHLYTGSIGYLDWRGDADWNVAIRTATVTPDSIRFSAGGGITAESEPEAEYLETLHKAEGMCRALEPVVGAVVLEPLPAGAL